jgi:AcrR family transcriptional regulator
MKKPSRASRPPLSRERILAVALDLADKDGLDSVSMRKVAQCLHVEAMSLYKHVANKDDLLDGLVELVTAQMHVPAPDADWKDALRERAYAVRKTLNCHPWASRLLEIRTGIGPIRLRHHDNMIGILRRAGFSIELAFNAMIALTSYVYGFVILEEADRLKGMPKDIANLEQYIPPTEYPYLFEMIGFAYAADPEKKKTGPKVETGEFADFEFGLGLLLEGFEKQWKSGGNKAVPGASS